MADYTPSEADARNVYSKAPVDLAGCHHKNPAPEFAGAQFDRFLARVRRDAAREALTDLVEAERDMALTRSAKGDHARFAQCMHAAQAAEEHRDIRYPEQED